MHGIEVKDITNYGRTYGWPVLWTTTAAPRTPCSHGCHTTARAPTGHGLWRTPCRTPNSHAGMSSHTPVHAPMANTLLIRTEQDLTPSAMACWGNWSHTQNSRESLAVWHWASPALIGFSVIWHNMIYKWYLLSHAQNCLNFKLMTGF